MSEALPPSEEPPEDDGFPNAKIWPMLTDDLKIAWDYYKINLQERSRIYENYFKTIGLPSALVSAAFLVLPRIVNPLEVGSQKPAIDDLGSGLFSLVSGAVVIVFAVAGMSMHILHCYEEWTSKDYMLFIDGVRKKIRGDYPNLDVFLKKAPRLGERPKLWEKNASYWRTIAMSLINSLLFAFGAYLILTGVFLSLSTLSSRHKIVSISISVAIYIISAFFHLRLQFRLSNLKKKKADSIRRA